MNLLLSRDVVEEKFTGGKLFIDGEFVAYTLEDKLREIADSPVESWKVVGSTAIPSGRYEVVVNYSKRFKTLLPLLLDVPGFSGIRIHPGNIDKDTSGCILVGSFREGSSILGSKLALQSLLERFLDIRTHITITNPT